MNQYCTGGCGFLLAVSSDVALFHFLYFTPYKGYPL